MSTASPRPVLAALHTVEASHVTQRSRCESKAAFKCYLQIQLSSRSGNNRLSAWLWTIHVCLHSSCMCVSWCIIYTLNSTRALYIFAKIMHAQVVSKCTHTKISMFSSMAVFCSFTHQSAHITLFPSHCLLCS